MNSKPLLGAKRKKNRRYKLHRLIERYWFFGLKTDSGESNMKMFQNAQRSLADYVARNADRIVWLPRLPK